MPTEIENLNPSVFKKIQERVITSLEEDEDVADPFDRREIFGIFFKNFLENSCKLKFQK